MMTPKDFASRRDQLRSLLLRAKCCQVLMLELWPTPERVDILNRFLGFFAPVRQAVFDAAFLSYAKAYDTDSRTASIRILLNAAKTNPGVIAPNATASELEALEALVRGNDDALRNLSRLRNKRLAHADANPGGDMSLKKGKLDQLVEDTERAFNALSKMHDGATTVFDMQVSNTERHTRESIEILQKAEGVRRRRGAARIRIADLLVKIEGEPAISASDLAAVRKLMERLSGDKDSSWILVRDDLPFLNQEASSEEAAQVFTEIRTLVDSALGL